MKSMDYLQRSYVAIASAIAILSERFDNISLPIRNSYYYDLIAEKKFDLFRVKVIYTDCRQPSGHYIANIRKSGGYRDKKEEKTSFNPKFCDYLFILTPEGKFLIPSSEVLTTRSITLSQFELFRISSVVEQ